MTQRTSQGWKTLDWYDTPEWYDAVFDVETPVEGDFLEGLHERWALPGRARRVLEPACGSGRLVVELARRGWSVTGFDRSEAMLEHARRRLAEEGLAARLELADMADFALRGRFDLAHCLVSTFKYLLDERSARSHLRAVARALRPGGLYVLGFHLTEYASRSRSRERWVGRRRGRRVVSNLQIWPADRAARTEDVRVRLRVEGGARELRYETNWKFRTYDAREVRRLLAGVPELEHVATHDFTYRLDRERELDDEQLDVVLVLRRRPTRGSARRRSR